MSWRVKRKCANCPFAETGKGRALRDSLAKGRWEEIIDGLHNDHHFICHKTADETGNGTNLVCAGSLEYCDREGISTNFQRVMERVEAIFARK